MTDATSINNRYQLTAKLGQGGMGAIYKAYDRPEKQVDFGSKVGTDDSEKLRLSLARVQYRCDAAPPAVP